MRKSIAALSLSTVLLLSPGLPTPAAGQSSTLWPVDGPVVREFDPPEPNWLPGHRGIDLAADSGMPVYTPRPGTIVYSGPVGGVPVVVVAHGLARATYQPVVAGPLPGDAVAAGDVIGTVADTSVGHCSGPCLHWGLKIGDGYADPRLLLGRLTVVLEPTPG